MRQIRLLIFMLSTVGCIIASGESAEASIIWGTSASSGNVNLEAIDTATGTLVQQFLAPNIAARSGNGRGIALLGSTIYYTTANSGNIYVTDTTSHADLGVLVNTGFNGIANVATDGTYIYANNYQDSSGVINKYDTSGSLIDTVTVGPGIHGRDGFEVQNNPNIQGGALTYISNRGDLTSPYDVYDSAGNLIISAFIDPSLNGFGSGQTGIAYDGTNYFVSQIMSNQLLKYSGVGTFIGSIDLSGIPNPYGRRLFEDLSAVGNTISNPGGVGTVPEPATLALLGLGLAGMGAMRRRKQA